MFACDNQELCEDTHVPRTSLKSKVFLMSSTCFFHVSPRPGSPFSRAMALLHRPEGHRRRGEDAGLEGARKGGREGDVWIFLWAAGRWRTAGPWVALVPGLGVALLQDHVSPPAGWRVPAPPPPPPPPPAGWQPPPESRSARSASGATFQNKRRSAETQLELGQLVRT